MSPSDPLTDESDERVDMANLLEAVKQAGVVGAGGAGFPTYQKLDAKASVLIANGAECEPLLNKDQVVMQHYTDELLAGMQLAMTQVGATEGLLGLKEKHVHSIEVLTPKLPANIRLLKMPNVYPAGDEIELIYEATGQRVPQGGLPKEIGVVVQNVETLMNVYRASQGRPVTHTMITVHGSVAEPYTDWIPIGCTMAEALEMAGGATVDDYVVVDGGPMMGPMVEDMSTLLTRTSSGVIVIPRDSHLAKRKMTPERAYKRIGKSGCDQCSLCTEMCPRYLLGYPIKPHLVMRSLLTTGEMSDTLTVNAQACCECNICSLWSCPEQLDPSNICVSTKRDLRANDALLSPAQLQNLTTDVHPMRDYRGVPTARLIRRLGLNHYDKTKAPFVDRKYAPSKVTIPLQQHIGAPAVATVKPGAKVSCGDLIGKAPDGALGVSIHASINGTVSTVDSNVTILAG
jgi:Na+-translocating ferredoxin:NAD+ oxidoreductase RnfC subunit